MDADADVDADVDAVDAVDAFFSFLAWFAFLQFACCRAFFSWSNSANKAGSSVYGHQTAFDLPNTRWMPSGVVSTAVLSWWQTGQRRLPLTSSS